MGRGTSRAGAGGGQQSSSTNTYLQGYLDNNPWLSNMDEESRNNMIEHFNNMPPEQQYYYSLTQAEQNAIVDMQYNTKRLNEYMSGRDTDFSDAQKEKFNAQIDNVKSAISKYDSKEPVNLYRGVSESEFNSIVNGGKTESFKSASTDAKRADSFAQNQGGYTVIYRASRGARIADVNGAPGANEKEFLIDSGVKYKKVTKKGKTVIIDI